MPDCLAPLYDLLFQHKEVIMSVTNIIVAGAATIAIYHLWLHRETVRLQRENLHVHLFKDISERINRLTDQWITCKTKEDREEWYERLFTAFEYFAFFANRGYLTSEMKNYYKSGVEECCQRLETKYPELLQHFKDLPSGQMDEFKKFYEDITGEKPPF